MSFNRNEPVLLNIMKHILWEDTFCYNTFDFALLSYEQKGISRVTKRDSRPSGPHSICIFEHPLRVSFHVVSPDLTLLHRIFLKRYIVTSEFVWIS